MTCMWVLLPAQLWNPNPETPLTGASGVLYTVCLSVYQLGHRIEWHALTQHIVAHCPTGRMTKGKHQG